jgi:hypothetical protein
MHKDWDRVDMESFMRCKVWHRPDLFQTLLHLGPLVGGSVGLCEVAWTAEFGLLGLGRLSAERISETEARVCGDLLTAPALSVTLELLVVPGCAGVHRARGLHVAVIEARHPP